MERSVDKNVGMIFVNHKDPSQYTLHQAWIKDWTEKMAPPVMPTASLKKLMLGK